MSTAASSEASVTSATSKRIEELRHEIDSVDKVIIDAIIRRVILAREIGELKHQSGLPVLDPAREAAVVSRAAAQSRSAGLPEQEMRTLYWQIMALARHVQMQPGVAV